MKSTNPKIPHEQLQPENTSWARDPGVLVGVYTKYFCIYRVKNDINDQKNFNTFMLEELFADHLVGRPDAAHGLTQVAVAQR